jgi:16S rRNA (cytidine1402-2'-O)-methyltransferase
MSGTLFVVATPIGNLEDITLRALRVLREVDLIAAEDTRRTAKLLAHHGIATPTISFHSHNARGRLPNLLQRLRNGESIALVSDAGTPGISDPGEELVRACIEYQVRIDPLPGATAPLTAVVASGFPLIPLTVYGFAPHRSKDRIAWFTSICSVQHTFTFFESPQRISGSLADGSVIFGDRPIIVARELTKMHQEIVRGTFAELSSRFTAAKGEFTVVVGPANQVPSPVEPVSDAEIVAAFRSKGQIATGKRRAIVSELARRYNRPSREIYKIIEQAKDSGE